MTGSAGRRSLPGAIGQGAVIAFALLVLAAASVLVVGAAAGYRPVVILTGSMGQTAPPGSLVIAAPSDDVELGDVLVMRTEDRATVTHRVIDIELAEDGRRLAVTRGDANPDRDPEPYALQDGELVVEWVAPELGNALLKIREPLIGIALMALVIGTAVIAALRWIWASPRYLVDLPDPDTWVDRPSPTSPAPADERTADPGDARHRSVGPRKLVGATVVGAGLVAGGAAFSLYVGVDSVAANSFSTLPCFESQLDDVQSGQLVTSADGVTTVPVLAVDPTKAFLLFSASSAADEPDESVVVGRLASSTEIEFVRATDGSPPGDVVVEWSLVEYACGVTVQRGESTGAGAVRIDDSITAVDTEDSFVVAGSSTVAGTTDFGPSEQVTVELLDETTVRFEAAAPIPAGTVHPWQVVSFDHASDAFVQQVNGSLTAGNASTSVSIPSPVDTRTTMLLASVRSGNGGSSIGDRLVRTRLVDDSTVEISRQATTGTVDVVVQVIELRDGSTVTHGTLEMAAGTATDTATIPPVSADRSTAMSTGLLAGGLGGGSTDIVGDDVVGEGSARVRLVDATTVELTRDVTTAGASFAWQVVTWGGPSWADLDAPFRRRIDVSAGSVVAPDGYTTPVVIDHEAMVDLEISGASGDDLRVWRFDGTGWTEIDRVLDDASSWNSADTTFWFRTQESIAASETVSYWLYFGDPIPDVPKDDPANVWLVAEGFDDGTLGAFEDRTSGTGWYDADPWTRRIVLTIDPADVAADLADEVVLVRVTDPELTAMAQADGSDLRFTAADGTTALAHEIESFDAGAGELTAWVRVPDVSSSSSTTIHLYFGAGDAPAQHDPRTAWADDLAVWHLAADPAGFGPTLDDSGPQQHDGAALADAMLVDTQSGPGVELDGGLDRLESAPFLVPDGPISVSAWFRADALASDATLVSHGDLAAGGAFELAVDTSAAPTARFRLRVDDEVIEVTGGAIATATWHHVAAVWDESSVRLHVDGAEVGSAAAAGSTNMVQAAALVIGADPSGTDALDGVVGQVRLDDAAWSGDRIDFLAANLAAPTTLVAAAAPMTGTWFDQGTWGSRRPLVVDAAMVAGPLTDYPLLVQVTDADLAAVAQADGDDLVITDSDGTTRLDHHIEEWDAGTGTLTAWVRVPALDDAADTTLYLYVENPSAVDQQDPEGVWGPDVALVLPGPTD